MDGTRKSAIAKTGSGINVVRTGRVTAITAGRLSCVKPRCVQVTTKALPKAVAIVQLLAPPSCAPQEIISEHPKTTIHDLVIANSTVVTFVKHLKMGTTLNVLLRISVTTTKTRTAGARKTRIVAIA